MTVPTRKNRAARTITTVKSSRGLTHYNPAERPGFFAGNGRIAPRAVPVPSVTRPRPAALAFSASAWRRLCRRNCRLSGHLSSCPCNSVSCRRSPPMSEPPARRARTEACAKRVCSSLRRPRVASSWPVAISCTKAFMCTRSYAAGRQSRKRVEHAIAQFLFLSYRDSRVRHGRKVAVRRRGAPTTSPVVKQILPNSRRFPAAHFVHINRRLYTGQPKRPKLFLIQCSGWV